MNKSILFRFIIHRKVIFHIVNASIKFRLLQFFLDERKLLRYIQSSSQTRLIHHYREKLKPKAELIRISNKMLNCLFPNSNCLVRSLVKKEVLNIYGYQEKISLGIRKESNKLEAHAWITGEKFLTFNEICKL